MSFEARDWAAHHAPRPRTSSGQVDSAALHVLAELAEHADPDGGNTHPSTRHIADATGLVVQVVRRVLLRLEAAGLIIREGRVGRVTRWRLALRLRRAAEEPPAVSRRRESRSRTARRAAARERVRGTQSAVTGVVDNSGDSPGDSGAVRGTQSAGHVCDQHVSASDDAARLAGGSTAAFVPVADVRGTLSAGQTALKVPDRRHLKCRTLVEFSQVTPPKSASEPSRNRQGTKKGGVALDAASAAGARAESDPPRSRSPQRPGRGSAAAGAAPGAGDSPGVGGVPAAGVSERRGTPNQPGSGVRAGSAGSGALSGSQSPEPGTPASDPGVGRGDDAPHPRSGVSEPRSRTNTPTQPPRTGNHPRTPLSGSQGGSQGLDPGTRPGERCDRHADHPGDPGPCGACGDARRHAQRWDHDQAARRRAHERELRQARAELRARAIAQCPMCDSDGYDGTRLCRHDPAHHATHERGSAAVRDALHAARQQRHNTRQKQKTNRKNNGGKTETTHT